MPQTEIEYLPERWGPEWWAQLWSYAARHSEVTKMNDEERRQFFTEHDLIFRSWKDEDMDWVDVPPQPGFHQRKAPTTSPFHR